MAFKISMLILSTILYYYCKCFSVPDQNVFNYFWPLPNKVESGSKTHILNRYCKFILKINDDKEITKVVTSIYDKILNRNIYDNTNFRSFLNNNCSVNIDITV